MQDIERDQQPVQPGAPQQTPAAEQELTDLLKEALLADPATPEGKRLRSFAGEACVGQARDLVARSAGKTVEDAEPEREQARLHLYNAILLEHVHLVPAAEAPAGATPVCLLDPPPSAPVDVMATSAPLGAHVAWSVPLDDGGKPITRYDVTVTPPVPVPLLGALPPVAALAIKVSGTGADITGLLPGTSYTFTVTATNGDGTGPVSLPSNPVKPEVAAPAAPAPVTGRTSGALAVADWKDPASGAPFTGFWVTAYDATKLTPVAPIKKLAGDVRSASFDKLPKGSYVYGVRAFNAGGYGPEARSGATAFAPAPAPFTPKDLPQVVTDPLELFDLGDATDLLKPDLLQRRLVPALEKANKWRYEYLKGLASDAAQETAQYEQLLGQLMQMALTKVTSAQTMLAPVLQDSIKGLGDNLHSVTNLATSGPVKDVLERIAKAAGNVMGLEALIYFLLDENPVDFWVGLFDAMIDDVCAFDAGVSHTEDWLRNDYFASLASVQLTNAVKNRVQDVEDQVKGLVKPLDEAVDKIGAGVSEALRLITESINETLVATATVTGAPTGTLVVASPFPVIDAIIKQVKQAVADLATALVTLLKGLLIDPLALLIDLIKAFIVYPILAAFVISFALGPIAGAILAAIVVIAVVQLIRLVAQLLAGKLLDGLNDAIAALNAVVGELAGIIQGTIGALKNPVAELQQMAAHLLALEQLLPHEFMTGAASLIGEVRRALLTQATELALAAERALGIENATAFDVVRPNYDTGLPKAPRLPGGADDALFAGLAVIRDLNKLDRLRTRVLDPKEVVVTQRVSLFRLLGGLGSPLGATGGAAGALASLNNGGQMVVNLTEQAVLEQNYPGLYRAMVVDIKPIGLLAPVTAVTSVLPISVPLSLTHLGASRMRVKRASNPEAPPIAVSDVLAMTAETWADEILDKQVGTSDGKLAGVLADLEKLIVDGLSIPTTNIDGMITSPSVVAQAVDVLTRLPSKLATFTEPVIDLPAINDIVISALFGGFREGLPDTHYVIVNETSRRLIRPTREEVIATLHKALTHATTGSVVAIRNALRPVLVSAHGREYARMQAKVAKWAGAGYEEDRDADIGALGYVTLVQEFPVETAVFNLVPDLAPPGAGALTGGAGPQAVGPSRLTTAPATDLQYRPFENRGFEGDWLLSVENKLSPGTIVDLLLEVTVRGCYDESLAATVKAKRDQVAGQLERAQALSGQASKVLTMPGALPGLVMGGGASEIRTIHFSLRAHRDSVLTHALAAGQALGSKIVDGLNIDALAPLKQMEPYTPLKPGLKQVTLQFRQQRPTSLDVLDGLIAITPQTLGIADTLTESPVGAIVGVGIAILPSAEVAHPPPDHDPPPPELYRLQKLDVDPLLGSLLPQLDPTKPSDWKPIPPDPAAPPDPSRRAPAANNFEQNRGKRLFITMDPHVKPVPLKDIWHDATLAAGLTGPEPKGPRLGVDLGNAFDNRFIHDVIFSISVRIPVAKVQPAAGIS